MDPEKAAGRSPQYGTIQDGMPPAGKVTEVDTLKQGGKSGGLSPRTLWIIFVSSVAVIAIVAFLMIFDIYGVSFREGDDDDDDGDDDEDDDKEKSCFKNDLRTSNALYTRRLKKILLNTTKYPNAVCTDGTPAGYFFAPADPKVGHEHVWVMSLQGGSWCTDERSCRSRQQDTAQELAKQGEKFKSDPRFVGDFATTSDLWADEFEGTGLVAPHPCSHLYGANIVWLPYCSSDAWMSSRSASEETFGMHFQGASIVKAVLNEITLTHGLQEQAADEEGEDPLLVLSGASAGGRGAMIHLDYLTEQMLNSALGGEGSARVHVYGLLDSPLWIDIAPNVSGNYKYPTEHGFESTLEHQAKQAFALFNIESNLLDEDCLMDHAQEAWKCIFGRYRLKYLTTPYTIVTSSRDLFISTMEGHGKTRDISYLSTNSDFYPDKKLAFVQELSRITTQVLMSLKKARPEISVYMSSCIDHAYLNRIEFLNHVVNSDNSTTMMRAFEAGLAAVGLLPARRQDSDFREDACLPYCTFAPYNGAARGVFEGEAFEFEENFFSDKCPLGESCGPCHRGHHGLIRSDAEFPSDKDWLRKIEDIASMPEDFGIVWEKDDDDDDDSDVDNRDSDRPSSTELVFV
uniref:Pectin acetylesterase n=1 Tax=Pyramimonas obovata TaxID=1411642 RepID=A0A7S0MZ33_9CHLO|mmetsp:Transcript_16006/g.34767  ORF Transcript_16006/g.34767 Transcript_16006/m.34767 type:complete len:629 (+) Transcript_16006:195-2081(+)|eukprot:CAMPEP_0118947706 /NCGR_PEP_ID=MMETSP1169-20130426/46527_1 /TAXON_ID=36882 /ORGANISM="Pyramimonas obovata, Strain CCMP722" /LENGTH=628 /DNA_ID=CAMNT_0006893973 /DNA_START=110 /DNA_END=1996 /DNA_ORIENTATION=-